MASPDKHPISPPPEPPTEDLWCRLFIYLLSVYPCNPSCYIGRRQLIISVINLLTGTPHQKSHTNGAETNCLESGERFFSPPFFLSMGPFFPVTWQQSKTINLRYLKQRNDHNTTHMTHRLSSYLSAIFFELFVVIKLQLLTGSHGTCGRLTESQSPDKIRFLFFFSNPATRHHTSFPVLEKSDLK